MCRYVGIVVYQGLVEDVSIFKKAKKAQAWVMTLRQLYGWDDTSDSMIWDVVDQQPARLNPA